MGKIERRGLWIAGESVSGEQSRWFATMNPATDEVICEVAEAGDEDVDSGADCLEYFAGQASSLQGEYQHCGSGKKVMAGAADITPVEMPFGGHWSITYD
jgi:betaine-aldehyde dehydrogenase